MHNYCDPDLTFAYWCDSSDYFRS